MYSSRRRVTQPLTTGLRRSCQHCSGDRRRTALNSHRANNVHALQVLLGLLKHCPRDRLAHIADTCDEACLSVVRGSPRLRCEELQPGAIEARVGGLQPVAHGESDVNTAVWTPPCTLGGRILPVQLVISIFHLPPKLPPPGCWCRPFSSEGSNTVAMFRAASAEWSQTPHIGVMMSAVRVASGPVDSHWRM